MKRILPALGLFLLAPLVAEYLLGNVSIVEFGALLFLAPLYGGGALLIREIARRAGRGWPTILLLAAAYGIVEEGLATQSLFNPDYVGLRLLDTAYVPALGIGAWWTIYVITLHTVWSIAVPIVLVETFAGDRKPWLGRLGLGVVAALYLAGVAVNVIFAVSTSGFTATPAQLALAAAAVVVLVLAAFVIGRRPTNVSGPAAAPPNAWLVGLVSLIACSFFVWFSAAGRGLGWLAVIIFLALFAAMIMLVRLWSRGRSWGPQHKLALAGGALLSYAWHAFGASPTVGTGGPTALLGNAIFAAGALLLLALAIRHCRRAVTQPDPTMIT
ncbi:hypothetical protein [Microlunatus speluncae]|uniref:hypothetical protein n=1 Tax=Microlunatus speluncae TaxID=2594267 RepID=UPI0012660D65|nr:hypothetical protein [Microlunatus speluncae]